MDILMIPQMNINNIQILLFMSLVYAWFSKDFIESLVRAKMVRFQLRLQIKIPNFCLHEPQIHTTMINIIEGIAKGLNFMVGFFIICQSIRFFPFIFRHQLKILKLQPSIPKLNRPQYIQKGKSRIITVQQQLFMLLHIFLIVLSTFPVASDYQDGNQCSECQNLLNGCNICYQNCNSTFVFKSCYLGEQDEQVYLQQSQCLSSCCSFRKSQFQRFSSDILTQCSKNTNSYSWIRTAGYYAVIATGGITILILIIIIGRALYVRASRRHFVPRRVIPLDDSLNQFSNHQVGGNGRFSESEEKKQFPDNANQIIEDEENTCCICLEGSINTITRCGHVFHMDCLNSWNERKGTCPLCNYKDISTAKLYCKTCKAYMRQINLIKQKKKKNVGDTCSKCKV